MGNAGGEPIVWVVRHGETEWSRSGRHTGRTDLPLTADGEAQARRVGGLIRSLLAGSQLDLVLCSPLLRARKTAELAGLYDGATSVGACAVLDDLREWDYGDLEGMTTAEICAAYPGWSIWEGPWPGGETSTDIAERSDRVIARVLSSGASQVALVGHGHFSRATAGRWVGEAAAAGRWLALDTASVSTLGWSRDERVVERWNLTAVPM